MVGNLVGANVMIFSNPSEYAIRALSELVLLTQGLPGTKDGRSNFIMLTKLTEEAGLPREFLAKIFRQLVEGELLISAKGPGGGFALARPPEQITLVQIIEAIDGGNHLDACVVGLSRCNDTMPCPQHDLFKPIRQRLRDYLATTSLADTAASLKEKKVKGRGAVVTPA